MRERKRFMVERDRGREIWVGRERERRVERRKKGGRNNVAMVG